MRWAFAFARAKAGKSMLARMAMMAMTTNNSIRVKAPIFLSFNFFIFLYCFLIGARTEFYFFIRVHSICIHYSKDSAMPAKLVFGAIPHGFSLISPSQTSNSTRLREFFTRKA
jgi:hypothetical protein